MQWYNDNIHFQFAFLKSLALPLAQGFGLVTPDPLPGLGTRLALMNRDTHIIREFLWE